jgi:POT family proton-dependent oligopeptide transporter
MAVCSLRPDIQHGRAIDGHVLLGLVLIVFGTGLLNPNISVMVGQLYSANDHRRDAGFSIFYMGSTLARFFSPLVCGYLDTSQVAHTDLPARRRGDDFGLISTCGSRALGNAGPRNAAQHSRRPPRAC